MKIVAVLTLASKQKVSEKKTHIEMATSTPASVCNFFTASDYVISNGLVNSFDAKPIFNRSRLIRFTTNLKGWIDSIHHQSAQDE